MRFIAVLLACLCVAACDNAPDNERQSHSAASTLNRGNGAEPESLDIHRARSEPALTILRDLYEGLASLDKQGHLAPGAAADWAVSDDRVTWTFALRPDGRWSDGSPVTSQDFVRALRRLVDPATAAAYPQLVAPIKNATAIIAGDQQPEALGVYALSPNRLQISLEAPTPWLPQMLTHPATFPLPAAGVASGAKPRPGQLLSNGAYTLDQWVVGSHVTARVNAAYRNAPAFGSVVYHHITNAASELKRYRAGELDITYTVPVKQVAWVRQHLADDLHIAPVLNTYYYGFNLTRKPFQHNTALRTALSLAIDRELLVAQITGAGEQPAYGLVPPGIDDYTPQVPEWHDWPRSKRNAEAQTLYRQAGYSDAAPLVVELRFNSGQLHKRIALAIAAMWQQTLGVQVTLHNEEWKVFVRNRRERQLTQVFRAGWIGDYNDASTYANILLSDHGANDTGFANTQYDQLVRAAADSADKQQRRALLERAEQVMIDEAPIAPLFFYVSKHLVRQHIDGWRDHVMDHHYSRHLAPQL